MDSQFEHDVKIEKMLTLLKNEILKKNLQASKEIV